MRKIKRSFPFVLIILTCIVLSACSTEEVKPSQEGPLNVNNKNVVAAGFDHLDLPDNYDVRQFEGMSLNFIVENNLSANIIERENEEFQRITGINVKIHAMDFDTLFQKINLDFISKSGKYQVVYVDPYKTLNQFSNYLVDLNIYQNDGTQPSIIDLKDDYLEQQIQVSSYFLKDDHLYTIPFDGTTMILYYRKDIFEKYKDAFYNVYGFDWTPGGQDFTWDNYLLISKWIDDNIPDDVVRFGSGHMAQKHNAILCDFSNVLAAYGGDYFTDSNISTYGKKNFKYIDVKSDAFIKALETYKKIIELSAPESINWNWTDSTNAFKNGEIAMMPNWDENYASIEYGGDSYVSGNVGYSLLPKGDVRSANIYGGSGIGINKYADEEEKRAAWLFITWATSKEMQQLVQEHPESGGIPIRKSLFNSQLDEKKEVPEHTSVVFDAWHENTIYLRPKISNFYEFEQVIIHYLHEMVENDIDPVSISERIYDDLKSIREKNE